ncbi:putative metal-binding motif-containing protein [Myxococcota bacterium]|nr:putative metal-binding motif-containing protein [Myxococcota bacterium]
MSHSASPFPMSRAALAFVLFGLLAMSAGCAPSGDDDLDDDDATADDDSGSDDDTAPDDDSASDDDTADDDTVPDDDTADDDTSSGLDQDGDGFDQSEDCDDHNATVYPGADEDGGTGTGDGDGLDNDCDTLVDEGTTAYDDDGDEWSEVEGDCNDQNATVRPGAVEVLDGVDQDCNGLVDDGTDGYDDDGDGHTEVGGDCDDAEPAVYPGAEEDGGAGTGAGDGLDNDCDTLVDEGTTSYDDDGDGFSEAEGDCNDGNATIRPGAAEIANGIDDDCDGTADEGTSAFDDDGDGYCEGASCVGGASPGDCDDTRSLVYPGASEALNGRDDDCDGLVDEGTEGADDDGDGYTGLGGDCDDSDASVHPGAAEAPNGVDDDCDGLVDEGTTAYDDDGDGYCELSPCTQAGVLPGDCNDVSSSVRPGATETADGIDQDCDGLVDEGTAAYDDDGDGWTENAGDCDDANALVRPGATEVADGRDNDCDGTADEGTTAYDDDGDGYCETSPCTSPGDVGGDCNDASAGVRPGAAELANGIDEDCDGVVDEGTTVYDDDGDGWTEASGDCDDANAARFPYNSESRDGLDNDCDGTVDEGTTAYDDDGDGYCETAPCVNAAAGGDCDDTTTQRYPGRTESLDGVDNDCDGTVDEGTTAYDDDGDGYCETEPCVNVASGGDCDDADPDVSPGGDDVPSNGLDENCSGADAPTPEKATLWIAVEVTGPTVTGRLDIEYRDTDGNYLCWDTFDLLGNITVGPPEASCDCDDTWHLDLAFSADQDLPCDWPEEWFVDASEREQITTWGVTHDVSSNPVLATNANIVETYRPNYDAIDGFYMRAPSWAGDYWDPTGIFVRLTPAPVPMSGYYDTDNFWAYLALF